MTTPRGIVVNDCAWIGPSVEDRIDCAVQGCEQEAVWQVGIFAPAEPRYYCDSHLPDNARANA